MSVVIEKGAIRSQIRGIENLPIIISLYEVIDDRKHSNSNKVFIDIDLHNHTCIIGYSEEATKDNIDNMVKWFNTNKEQTNINNIASKGIGLKYFEFRALGTWKHITKHFNEKIYYTSEINTFDIWNAENNDDKISSIEFSEILRRGTSLVKEEDELSLSIENIFNNVDNKYPFLPKTIFRCNNLKNLNLLDEYKDEEKNFKFDDIIKRLKIKYYNEISHGLELYIKLPGYTEFKVIENNNIDVIGFTNNRNDELRTDIFINPNYYFGYFFKIGENAYEFRKNGNSIIRQKINNISNYITPDFSLFQYNINNMSKEDKNNSIYGKSEEACAGLFIEIGGTFISDQPVEWQIIKRNLAGSKNYRAVLQCLSTESKYHLMLSGLKAQFNLATMNNLHTFIKYLTDVYKAYIKHISSTSPLSINSDDYVIIKTTASKSGIDKQVEGYFYIVELGNKFFKFGFSGNQQRIFDYITEEYVNKNRLDYPDIEFHTTPHCRYLSIQKIKKIKLFEEKIKSLVNESTICQTYDCLNGIDIREYFLCDNFDQLFALIINEINEHK
uniref:Uncharacterized protein n=1 Tax=viral metagenome TaxID=1070528 RepID=A0A6C0E512_9ZZZZ